MDDARREEFEGNEDRGDCADEESEDPHQSAGEDLILERSDAEDGGSFVVRGIEDAIAEGEKCAERSTWKCSQEKIERDGPARPACFRWKGLDDGPPEEDGSREEAGVFNFVPRIGTESEFECGRNMPRDQSDCGENPTDKGMGEKFSERSQGWPAQERAESGAHKPLRESVEKRQGGRTEKNERRDDKH